MTKIVRIIHISPTKPRRHQINYRPPKTNAVSPITLDRRFPSTTNHEEKAEWSDGTNKDHSNKKYSFWFITICIIAIIVLFGGIIVAVVIPIVIRTKTTTVTPPPAILRWNPNGTTIAGVTKSAGATPDKLNMPWDLFVDYSYTLYVTDRFNNRVQKFLSGSTNGTTIAGRANGTPGKSVTTFNQTSGISVNSSGNIYVADMFNHRVQFFSKDNSTGVTIAGTGIAGSSINQLNMPHSLEYESNSSTLYITDAYNHRIMRYLLHNSSRTVVAGGNGQGITKTQLSSPHAVFYDSSSNSLLIANNGGNNIVRWVLGAKSWTLVAGSANGASGKNSILLNGPTDVMLDPMGNMYVADRANHRIQFFPNGQSNGTTIAGITAKSGYNSTMLSYPNSVALDNQLNLYVVDHYNHRIQKFFRY